MIIMRFNIRKLLLLLSLVLSLQVFSQNKWLEINNFGTNEGKLKMLVFKPNNLKNKSPLVVALHGCGQTAREFADQSGWNKLAVENKFIVLYPQQSISNNLNKCFNWFNKIDISKDGGESKTIEEMIKYSVDHLNIDSSKIFVVGLSAGGAMANILMANYPNLINSGAIISGIPFKAANDLPSAFSAMQGKIKKTPTEWISLIKDNNPNYKGKYPRVIIFHGMNDPFVNSANADISVLQWKGIHNITNKPKIITNFNDNNDITKIIYSKNKKPTIVEYKIANLGHAMAINPGIGKKEGGKVGKFSVDKNFNSAYRIALFFKIII